MNSNFNGNPISKKCSTDCPNCGADEDNIKWGEKVWEDIIYMAGTCKKCGCNFRMYFEYTDTEFYLEQCKRVPCTYPMSKFYNTMDEVPYGTRVSDPNLDCVICKEDECEEDYCLISESEEPDYIRDLYLAAKNVIRENAIDIVNPPMAKISDILAKAVEKYEKNK